MAEQRNRAVVIRQLAELGPSGRLTERDELLLRTVREVGGLTLGQARRLFWPEASTVVAYQRLNKLQNWGLLRSTPLSPEIAAWGFGPGPIYEVGPGGQLWLNSTEPIDWQGRSGRWSEPLLAAELLVRLALTKPGISWYGAAAARSKWKLEPVVAGAATRAQDAVIFYLAGLVQATVDWGEMSRGFDRAVRGGRPGLPPVAILLRDGAMVSLVSELLAQRRRRQINYLLGTWSDLAGTDMCLTDAPLWRHLPPEGEPIEGQSLNQMTTR